MSSKTCPKYGHLPEVGTGLHACHPQPAVLPSDDQVTDPGANENWASQLPDSNFPRELNRGSPETTSTQKPPCWLFQVGLWKGAQCPSWVMVYSSGANQRLDPPLTGPSFLDLV